MPWIGKVAGVVEAWYAGRENGKAIAAVLFGDVHPSGRLPITFPRAVPDHDRKLVTRYPRPRRPATAGRQVTSQA
jgi:beta-glucosidase